MPSAVIIAPAFVHDDVFDHPDLLVSLEAAGLEEVDFDTIAAACRPYYADEDGHAVTWH